MVVEHDKKTEEIMDTTTLTRPKMWNHESMELNKTWQNPPDDPKQRDNIMFYAIPASLMVMATGLKIIGYVRGMLGALTLLPIGVLVLMLGIVFFIAAIPLWAAGHVITRAINLGNQRKHQQEVGNWQ